MSSINEHFTFHYSQPEAYRFSHDSVFLARRVFELYADQSIKGKTILDLCAGCGIVGLDFLFSRQTHALDLPRSCDFVEVQEVYAAHFALNRTHIKGVELNFLPHNYASAGLLESNYDLILCNPPFFRPGHGRLSPSEFKNRCRFFIDSDLITLMQVIQRALNQRGGVAYVLLRDLRAHGSDIESEARRALGDSAQLWRIGEIRGTGLFKITRIEATQN
jgi:tRNA1Val (adenine37-N6)-methyltransferase